jgi:hypothetical protein
MTHLRSTPSSLADRQLLDKLKKLRNGDVLVLATADHDLCNVPRCDALTEARKIADELNQTIHVRNALTDQRYGTVRPSTH